MRDSKKPRRRDETTDRDADNRKSLHRAEAMDKSRFMINQENRCVDAVVMDEWENNRTETTDERRMQMNERTAFLTTSQI